MDSLEDLVQNVSKSPGPPGLLCVLSLGFSQPVVLHCIPGYCLVLTLLKSKAMAQTLDSCPRPWVVLRPLAKALLQASAKALAKTVGCKPWPWRWASTCVVAKALAKVLPKASAKALATSTMAKALAKGVSVSLELPSDKAIWCYHIII